jgi:Mg-chelatase subunit ChlI
MLLYKSKYKKIFEIKAELTWLEQRDDVITKILPKLTKEINKKYKVASVEIKDMLKMNLKMRRREWRLKVLGKTKQNRRRMNKNAYMKTVRL